MGTTDISSAKSASDTIDESWYNDFRSLLLGALVGRNPSTGAVASGQDLGSSIYPFGNVHAAGLIIGGSAIDFGNLSGLSNSIISGKIRSTSAFPDFLRANGAAASFQVLGSTTNLVVNIGGTAATITTDITESSLTTAPASNNTASINDTSLIDQESSKWQGEDGSVITIDSVGSEISSRVGQYCVFKKDMEYFLAYINSSTQLTNCYRGFFFDSSGNPVDRVTLADNDTISLMSTAWVFVENNATTVDVTYTTPVYSDVEPGSPATGDYWFDMVNELWKRYNGSSFVAINRILVGIAVIDTSNCVATRCMNFNKDFKAPNPVKIEYVGSTQIKAIVPEFDISVYGLNVSNKFTQYIWDITTDLESGVTESANTTYYAYISDDGKAVLSDKKPYNQNGELKGWYHPYNAWRAVGHIFNNGSSNFDSTTIYNYYNASELEITEQGLSNLKAQDGLTPAADKLFYFTSAIAGALTTLTSFARSLLDDSSASAARSTLGLGSLATLSQVTSGQLATGTSERDWVLARTADAAAGVVGTYAFFRNSLSSGTITFGTTVAGSNLRPSNANGSIIGSTQSGTWRSMGQAGSNGTGENDVTLWLRIS